MFFSTEGLEKGWHFEDKVLVPNLLFHQLHLLLCQLLAVDDLLAHLLDEFGIGNSTCSPDASFSFEAV